VIEMRRARTAEVALGADRERNAASRGEETLAPLSRCIQSLISSRGQANGSMSCAEASAPKRKPRVARAKVSAATRGVVPTTLGGKLPPISVLSRREFGLRALRR
jgi:hypothetical protein